ncbi:hypothetical protein [Glycomyces algeriensis]|uniref:YbaB/EbfC DNA-binding family protein n=1 Tax=Glycomyces algeriensis TaxID=256037 RepID=A0A9W6LEN2_9ACTN|nr:hypothetical protein [Glycomyces algeriensis]MDA1367531.1 hypothetical protein [Glycomyces algeriensis]MDR7353106.1 hypothetical protein [Glycomyces algeriensis]GLI40798.1 hypothetical protein GALLR39Z86_06480 [Glycomyces algeriensis]
MFGEDAIAQQLADARATLSTAIKSPEAGQVAPVVVEGVEGLLRLTLGTEGRVDKFEFDPRIMRIGSEVLFGEIKRMVNAALDERAEAIGTDEPLPDLEAINESVAEIQDRSLRQFQAMRASIDEVMSKIHGGK